MDRYGVLGNCCWEIGLKWIVSCWCIGGCFRERNYGIEDLWIEDKVVDDKSKGWWLLSIF